MFFLFVTVSLINLGLGYALAVHLGWGKWPDLRDHPVAQPQASEKASDHAGSHDHATPAAHSHH